MPDPRDSLCHRARAFSGGHRADTVAEGVIVAVCTEPTYTIRTADGEQVHWVASLTEVGELVPDAEIPPAAWTTRREAPMPPEGLSPGQLDDIRARYAIAVGAGTAADDAGEGWDTAKTRAVVASWQDVSTLYDEVMRLRRPDPTQALTTHWWGRQIPRDAGAVARQSIDALERAGYEVRRRHG